MNNQRPPNPTTPHESVPASPRAFASASGLVFQTVGAVFLLGSCGFWSLSGRIAPEARADVETWTDLLTHEHAEVAAMGLGLLTTFLGGIALATVGLGLTGQTRRSGTLAMIVSLAMTCVYAGIAGTLVFTANLTPSALVSGAFALMCLMLFLLAGHSASLLRRFPPPPDQNKATKAFLEEHDRQRAERRRRESL